MIKLGLKNVENIYPEWVLESNINETIYDQFVKNQFHYSYPKQGQYQEPESTLDSTSHTNICMLLQKN